MIPRSLGGNHISLWGVTLWMVPTDTPDTFRLTDESYDLWRRAGYIQSDLWLDDINRQGWMKDTIDREGCRFAVKYSTHTHFLGTN